MYGETTMCNISKLQSSLCEVSSDYLRVLELHSYDADLAVEAFTVPLKFSMAFPLHFSSKVQVLCILKSTFIILTLSSCGDIITDESGVLDDEIVLSVFGRKLVEIDGDSYE